MKVERATSKDKANFPYVVQRLSTENWNTWAAFKSEKQAVKSAEQMATQYPNIRWRILHCIGGTMP